MNTANASINPMRSRLVWLGGLMAALLALFWSTFADIVHIWWRSATFAHGFFVLPIVGYLIWRKRSILQQIPFTTAPLAIPLIALTGLLWLLARLTEVAVVEQLAAVLLIPLLVWLALGWAAIRVLAFPLAFLLFAVPMGEELVYPLMQFTAAMTVGMLRLTGLQVFSDGTFFSLPSGDWSVVAACSGIRYLIASLFLGVLYAYLNYRSVWRRIAFIALSAIVPVFANGVRAYLIVMIGHLSGMRLAVGVDHLIYGWVFFGLVMFLLFALGNLWSEPPLTDASEKLGSDLPTSFPPEPARRSLVMLTLGLLMLALGPLLANLTDRPYTAQSLAFEMPAGRADWQALSSPITDWKPRYLGASLEVRQDFQQPVTDHPALAGVYLAFYGNPAGELVNSENVLVTQNDPAWQMPSRYAVQARIAGQDMTVNESKVRSSGQTLLVWDWYWIDGHLVASDYGAKLYEALAVILGRGQRQAGVVLYTTMDEVKPELARKRLQRFADDMLPSLAEHLNAIH